MGRIGDLVADWITGFSGTWAFLWLHLIWWGFWKLLALPVDDLTLWVSLEAIVLSIFVLMSQSRQAQRTQRLIEEIHANTIQEESEIEEIEGFLLSAGDE